jgi:Asp-tRNA(Asn)/Glu-tRNA(Gln) amidotransferase A subunit family amidase
MGRDVETCARMMEALAPGFERIVLASLDEVDVGTAWVELGDPLVARCVEEAAAGFRRRRKVEFPLVEGIAAVFMREAAESHSELFAEHAGAYGANVRAKLERCLQVSDAEHQAGLGRLEEYRQRGAEAFAGLDLLITPTLAFVAPPAFEDDRQMREPMIRFTYPFNALGWPALALPCGAAEHGLPASIQIVGRFGDDARVLAAGALLEQALTGR